MLTEQTPNLTKRSIELANKNLAIFDNLYSYYQADYATRMKYLQYYHNKQFTEQQAQEFAKETNVDPYVINILRTTIEQETAILTSDRPVIGIKPINAGDKATGYLFNEILFAVATNNQYDLLHAEDIKNMLTTGIAWTSVRPADTASDGFFGVKLESVPFYQVFPDPRVSKHDFSDLNKLLYYYYIPLEEALAIVGKSRKDFHADYREYQDIMYTKSNLTMIDDRVLLQDHFSQDLGNNPMVLCIELYEREIITLNKVETLDHNLRVMYKLPLWLDDAELTSLLQSDLEFVNYVKQGIITVTEEKTRTVYKSCSYGYYGKERQNLKIEVIPIVPLVNEWNGSVLEIYGETQYLKPMQEALNKFLKLTLANAALSSVGRVIYDKQAVTEKDVEDFITGAVTKLGYNKTSMDDKSVPVSIINAQPLGTGYFQLFNDMFQRTEYVSGLYSVMLGDSKGAPDVFSTMAALENFGSQRIKLKARRITDQRAILAKAAIQVLQRIASVADVVRYVSETGEESEIPVFIPEYNNAANIINILFDFSATEFDVVRTTQPNLGTTRAAKANLLATLLAQQNIPPTPGTMKVMAELTDIPELDQIMPELDQAQQAQQAAEQMQVEMQKLQVVNEQLQKKLVESAKKIEIKDFEVALDKILTQYAADTKISSAELKQTAKQIIAEFEILSEQQLQQQDIENKKQLLTKKSE